MRFKSIHTYIFGLLVVPVLGFAMSGCGNSATESPLAANQTADSGLEIAEFKEGTETPEKAVEGFLHSLYRNQQKEALQYLSEKAKKARLEHAKREGSILFFEPPLSRDATYRVVRVNMSDDETAQVEAILTDYDIDGYETIDPPIFWSVKLTPQGWRITGAAVVQYEGMPPIVVNLEDIQATERAIEMAYRQHEQWEEQQQAKLRENNNGTYGPASYREYEIPAQLDQMHGTQEIPSYGGPQRINAEASSNELYRR